MLNLRRSIRSFGLAFTVLASPAAAQVAGPLHVVSVGTGADAVVVLHGGPGFRHNYLRPEWDQLASRGRVIYYDQRGCGRSTREGPFRWQQHVDDLHQLLRLISPERPVVLAGLSWGAMLAVHFAHAHPTLVRTLVLPGVPPWDVLVERRRTEYAQLSPEQRIRRDNRIAQAWFDPSLHMVRDSAWLVNESGAPPNDPLAPRLGDFCMLPSEITLSSLYDAPRIADLRALDVPTLITLGDQPDSRGSSAEALAEALPRAQLLFIPGAGHDPWLEQPERFFGAVHRFLADGR